jgi:hypothetical protein
MVQFLTWKYILEFTNYFKWNYTVLTHSLYKFFNLHVKMFIQWITETY